MLPTEFQLRIGIYIILGLSMVGSFVLGLYGIEHEIFRDPAIGEMLPLDWRLLRRSDGTYADLRSGHQAELRRFHPVVWHQLRGEPLGLRNFVYRQFHSENYFMSGRYKELQDFHLIFLYQVTELILFSVCVVFITSQLVLFFRVK
jgi:hypothetical protein